MIKKFFKKFKKETLIPTTTLKHYKITFMTVHGEILELNNLKYLDENEYPGQIENYIKNSQFLQDDAGTFYPIANIVSISCEADDIVENAIKIMVEDLYSYQMWYGKNEIKRITN